MIFIYLYHCNKNKPILLNIKNTLLFVLYSNIKIKKTVYKWFVLCITFTKNVYGSYLYYVLILQALLRINLKISITFSTKHESRLYCPRVCFITSKIHLVLLIIKMTYT